MTTQFTDEKIAELRALAEKATQGILRVGDGTPETNFEGPDTLQQNRLLPDEIHPRLAIVARLNSPFKNYANDARYWSAAANTLPAALDEIVSLRAELNTESVLHDKSNARVVELETEIKRLRAVASFARHTKDCEIYEGFDCTCGFEMDYKVLKGGK